MSDQRINQDPNQYSINNTFSFLNQLFRPPTSSGVRYGSVGDAFNFANFMPGGMDPGSAMLLNLTLAPFLTGMIGGQYTSAQYSSQVNMRTQMGYNANLMAQNSAMTAAAGIDSKAIFRIMQGSANLLGTPMGARERANARGLASTISNNMPMVSMLGGMLGLDNDFLDRALGSQGSAYVMAQNIARGGRYAVDPVTGRRGYTSESSAEITKGIFNRLYGDKANIAEMGGMTAGRAGSMFDEMQRRGMMSNSTNRNESLKKIADQMGKTIGDVTNLPDLDRKLRELDAGKISDRLKGMSKAVNAMAEVFGEAGVTNAPMSQLIGAIETLTQSSMQNMDPKKLERMVRETANTAKAAGIEMPEMFRLMGNTAAMADRHGVNRSAVPGITMQAVMENQAMKNIYGGARAYGTPSADSLLNITSQLNIQAERDHKSQDAAAIVRAVEEYGIKPTGDLKKAYDAIKDPNSGGDYKDGTVTKNVYDLISTPGKVNSLLSAGGVSDSVIQSILSTSELNKRIIERDQIGKNITRPAQASLFRTLLANSSQNVVQSFGKDDKLMQGVDAPVKAEILGESAEISKIATDAVMNVGVKDVGEENAPRVIKAALAAHFKSKGLTISDSVLQAMSAGLGAQASSVAHMNRFPNLTTAQMTLSKKVLEEAAAGRQEIAVQNEFESIFGGMGKKGLTTRLADFLTGGTTKTTLQDFAATIFNYQSTPEIAKLFEKELEALRAIGGEFGTYSGAQVKDEYLHDAISVNAADLAAAIPGSDKHKALLAKQAALKKSLIQSDYANVDDVDAAYESFNRNPTVNRSLENSRKNLDTLEARRGVTDNQAMTLSVDALGRAGRMTKNIEARKWLGSIETKAKAMGWLLHATDPRFTKISGLLAGEGNSGQTAEAIEDALELIAEQSTDLATVKSGGTDRLDAVAKFKAGAERIRAIADHFGEQSDILDPNFEFLSEKDYIQQLNQEQASLTSLAGKDGIVALNSLREQASEKQLELTRIGATRGMGYYKDAVKKGDEASLNKLGIMGDADFKKYKTFDVTEKAKLELSLTQLNKLVALGGDPVAVKAQLDETYRLQKVLDSTSFKNDIEAFKTSNAALTKATSGVEYFLEKSGLAAKTMAGAELAAMPTVGDFKTVNELRKDSLANAANKLGNEAKIQDIVKKSKLGADRFVGLTDENYAKISGLVNNKEFSTEEVKRIREAAKIAGMTPEELGLPPRELLDLIAQRQAGIKQTRKDFNQAANEEFAGLKKAKDAADEAANAARANLIKNSNDIGPVFARLSPQDRKDFMKSQTKYMAEQLIRTTKQGKGGELSYSEAEARARSAILLRAGPGAVRDALKILGGKDLGKDLDKNLGTVIDAYPAAAGEVVGDLDKFAEGSSRLGSSTKKASTDFKDRLKAMRDLLNASDTELGRLSPDQRRLRGEMDAEGLRKEMLTTGGDMVQHKVAELISIKGLEAAAKDSAKVAAANADNRVKVDFGGQTLMVGGTLNATTGDVSASGQFTGLNPQGLANVG